MSKRGRWFNRARVAVAGLMVVLYFLTLQVAYAIADPDTININAVRAYDSVLEDGDILFLVDYNLDYASIPDETITVAYIGRFLTGTTEHNSIEPFAFNDKGYGRGLFTLYFNAADKTTASIEFDNPNSEDYAIELRGKAGVFPGSPPLTTTGTITFEDATNTKALLGDFIQDFAQLLEKDSGWSANSQDLIASQQLTATGDDYFSNAVPQLAAMVPEIFSNATTAADFSGEVFDESLKEDLDKFWDGNWVDVRFQNLADTYKVPKAMLTAGWAFFWMMMIAWFVAKMLDNTERANEYGVLTIAVTLPMFGAVGWIPLEVVMVVATLAILGLAWTMMGRRA